jgi:hypothetical protein
MIARMCFESRGKTFVEEGNEFEVIEVVEEAKGTLKMLYIIDYSQAIVVAHICRLVCNPYFSATSGKSYHNASQISPLRLSGFPRQSLHN